MDRRRVWWIAGGAGTALVAGGLTVALWPSDEPEPLPVRARQYTDVRACLLTGAQGLAAAEVKPVWAGMQDASAAKHSQVSWLKAPRATTGPEAVPYANTLVQQRCSMVLAAEDVPAKALASVADANPGVRFVVVGTAQVRANLTVIPVGADVRAAVEKAVADVG
nr:hypothetical protein [Streptomyces sp. TLI_235]